MLLIVLADILHNRDGYDGNDRTTVKVVDDQKYLEGYPYVSPRFEMNIHVNECLYVYL